MKKATIPSENDAITNVDYTTIADRLRAVSKSNNCHPTSVVRPVFGIVIIPITAKAVKLKGHTFKKNSLEGNLFTSTTRYDEEHYKH